MTAGPPQPHTDYVRRHLRFGWWSLFVFLLLGATLETLHGFKAGFYLDVSNETRRLMWTLAHAHGALLGIVNVAAGVTLRTLPELPGDARIRLISATLRAATVLLPAGFFAGGVTFYSGDPGRRHRPRAGGRGLPGDRGVPAGARRLDPVRPSGGHRKAPAERLIAVPASPRRAAPHT